MLTKSIIAAAVAGALSLPIAGYANDRSAGVESDSYALEIDSASSGSSIDEGTVTSLEFDASASSGSSSRPHDEPVSE